METGLVYNIIAGGIFIIGYAGIALEHNLKISKSAVALLVGALLWILVGIYKGAATSSDLVHAGNDVFSIVVFLLAAMSLIEILVHYRFFDLLRGKLFTLHLSENAQFVVITFLAFFLSAVIDNLTTTIIMIQISRKFFKGQNLLIATSGIVIAANAGGTFSPIGDVTTIMLWFSQKFSALEIISQGFIPSLVIYILSTLLLFRQIKPSKDDAGEEIVYSLSKSEKTVVSIVFISFGLPVVMSFINLPPYMGLLLGLGVVWLCVDTFKRISKRETHLSASIDNLIKQIDISSLKFFIGILLAVSALHSLGTLEYLAESVYGHTPTLIPLITGNIGLGFLSAILDNVPLTAIAIQILRTTDVGLWVLLALSVGTGGSLLVIGSAAGVVAMGMVKELTFGKYFKIAFLPALIGFAGGIGVWALQYFIF